MPSAPEAPQRLRQLAAHDDVRLDPYYWLRVREDPEVRAYLEAENTYAEACLRHTRILEDALADEIRGRIPQTDQSAPYREGSHRYYWRIAEGQEYRVYCRQPVDGTEEEVVLDVNRLAEGCSYCDLGAWVVSPDERYVAYAVDTVGRRQYDLCIRDLRTGATLADRISGVTTSVAWAADSRTLLYVRSHPLTLRAYQVRRHALGQDAADPVVFEERDETFACAVMTSRSRRWLLIGSYHTHTTEMRVLDAWRPEAAPRVLLRRRAGHEYYLDHYRNRFYARSNAGAENFRLLELECPPGDLPSAGAPDPERWRDVVPPRDNVLLEDFVLFRDHLVTQERAAGLVRMCIRPWNGEASHEVCFPDPAYEAAVDNGNREPDTRVLRIGYSSMRTPLSVYAYDMQTRERTLLKRDEVLGAFDAERYRTDRVFATACDGTRIPISLVRRADAPRDGSRPLLLTGYGAYGISTDAGFRSSRLSLIDRGFTVAIAHVRGGQELGRRWYEDGRRLRKRNTFTDFIACAEHLVAERYTEPRRLFASGASAGGLLIGAVVNMRPDLFGAVIARVPFVDVLTTMLDPDIPLTTGEYDEWGDPRDPAAYRYIKTYSPYDNVTAQPYPAMLVLTGLHDSQVQYWEPAKWVARLRAHKTDRNPLILKTSMDAGHGGASGRYARYREIALQYAFLVDRAERSRGSEAPLAPAAADRVSEGMP